MRIGILPLIILAALSLFALAVWAITRMITEIRGKRRVPTRYAIVLMAVGAALWLGLCFFFMLMASLGHSAHPLRDSWPQCAASFFILIIAPLVLLIWLARQRSVN